MKTTVELDDALLKAARRRAIDENTTLRALVEEGLRLRLAENGDGERPQSGAAEASASRHLEQFRSVFDRLSE